MIFPRRFEGALVRADFARLLPDVCRGPVAEDAGGFSGQWGSGAWRIDLAPMAERVIGNVRLQRLQVSIAFCGCTAVEEAEFMARFGLRFQRGGG
ncbi:MAG TPA: hypothetical protein PKD29_05365 [Rhodocyclaceae bacterium]|nr:hypothetical protein [Rhodocyclaceae bacterium]